MTFTLYIELERLWISCSILSIPSHPSPKSRQKFEMIKSDKLISGSHVSSVFNKTLTKLSWHLPHTLYQRTCRFLAMDRWRYNISLNYDTYLWHGGISHQYCDLKREQCIAKRYNNIFLCPVIKCTIHMSHVSIIH